MLDFDKDVTQHVSCSLKTRVVERIEKLVKSEREAQPHLKRLITRSSVMSILLSDALDDMDNKNK